jgi:hypothetical protein
MILRGRSPREASFLAARAKQAMKERSALFLILSPNELSAVNEERRKQDAVLEGRRIRKRLITGRMFVSLPRFTTTSGVASTVRKKWELAQREPAASDWLRLMAEQIVILDATPTEERLEQIVRNLGPELEAHLKRVHARISG